MIKNLLTKFLVIIFITRLLSFFTFDEIGINSVYLKVILRLLADFSIITIPLFLNKINNIYRYNNIIIITYIIFIVLGIYSLYYTSSFKFSVIQIIMYIESFLFSIIFINFIFKYTINPYQTILKVIFQSIFIITVMSLLGTIFFTDLVYRYTATDEAYRLGGYLMNPNELGMLIVLGITSYMALSYIEKNKIKFQYILVIVLFLLALYLTQSRSSIIGLFVFITIYLYYIGYKKLLIVISLFLIIPLAFSFTELMSRGGNIEDVLTMTGRLPFWMNLLEDALPKEFLLGYGFQRIYYLDFYSSIDSYSAQMAHNTFIQIFLGLGVVGFLIGSIMILFIIVHLIKERIISRKIITISIFIPIFINSLTEFGIYGFYNFGVIFFQILIVFLTYQYSQLENRKKNE